MENSVCKLKYQKYKMRVKLWENEFKKKNGRIASKHDIRDAPQSIRDAYKMYYKFKTSFLEDTLCDVLADDDGFDMFDISQSANIENMAGTSTSFEDSFSASVNGGPKLPLDILAIVGSTSSSTHIHTNNGEKVPFSNLQEFIIPDALSQIVQQLPAERVIKEFNAVEESRLNQNAWGQKVRNQQPGEALGSAGKSFKSNLNRQHFKASSFSIRNPRKSRDRSSSDRTSLLKGSQTAVLDDTEQQEELLDLELILTHKAKEHQATAAIIANPLLAGEKSKNLIKTHVDEGWLNRTEAQNGINTVITSMAQRKTEIGLTGPELLAKRQTYGLLNVEPSWLVPTTANESIDSIVVTPEAVATTISMRTVQMQNEEPCNVTVSGSGSDSEVADSGGECNKQEYRQIAKRRRTLPSKNKSPADYNTENCILTRIPLPRNQIRQRNSSSVDVPSSNRRQPINEEETSADGVDFSADDDKAEDYVVEMQKKPKGKKAEPKCAKAQKKTFLPKALKKRKPPATSKVLKASAANPPKRTSTGRKQKWDAEVESAATNSAAAEVELVFNPKDLKYELALERGDINYIPRVQPGDLETADAVAQRYINTFEGAASVLVPLIPVANEKRWEARQNLEAKVAAGKLNENFITINIRKKAFVRGKKSVNFSKYKKQQWNKKHVASLAGPDMDMGGCDGGTLKCFTCGQTSHFARRCMFKGDVLLPLTAQLEEDPSPFPTLAEAEHSAHQNAVVVHSRNIAQLPQASRPAALNPMDEEKQVDTMAAANGKEKIADEKNSNKDYSYNSDDDQFMDADDELEHFDLNAATASAAEAETSAARHDQQQVSPIKSFVGHQIPEKFLRMAGLDGSDELGQTKATFDGVGAMYDLNADGSVPDVTPEVLEALHMFGHSSFRKGQDRAVMRILSGQSTLVTLSTGSGKSLCYQLPAYLYARRYRAITLVISPLVSLMEDQVVGVPHFLRAHCLHTNQTPQVRQLVQQQIADGTIDILLVSPEAVVSGERATGFGALLRQLPPIAFVCIDEAHCVSQWSHNFRPSYLMICKVLKQNLGVRTVLGLTATATLPTRNSIIAHLGIQDGTRGVISDIPLPDNLILSVSRDENKEDALLQLLNSKRFMACHSIIVYCTRRDESERIACFLRTCLQAETKHEGKKKRKRVKWQAEPYHAGMNASRRRTIQNAFMKNELRIVVATIAFGMGINKPDIRAIIHFNMPRNFESYVQEIGRAGRDGNPSHCHLFLDSHGNDQGELRRHIYANSIDRHVIRKLLQRIFVPCACAQNAKRSNVARDMGTRLCPGHEIGFSIEKTVEALDIPQENISTLLCYLELDPRWGITVLGAAYTRAKVISYGGPKYLKHAAKECPPLAMAIALEILRNNFKEDSNLIEFSVVDISAAIGWNSGVVKYQLKNLEWFEVKGANKRSPLSVSFYDLGFRLKASGDFTPEEIDQALDTLYNRSVQQERTQLIQLQYVTNGLSSVAYNSYVSCTSEHHPYDRSDQLKGIIRDYFQNDYLKEMHLEIEPIDSLSDENIENDVYALINMYPDNNFSGRNVARIFYGISSPNFPALIWYRCKYWRAHSKINFNRIVQLANSVIVKLRS